MDNKEFGKLFNILCESVEKTDSHIADKLGVDRATIGRWRKGERTPSLSLLPQIAKYFNISLDVFTLDTFDNDIKVYKDKSFIDSSPNIKTMTHSVPIYGRIPAGVPFEAIQEISGDVAVPDKIAKKKDLFALKIIGDSMDKVLPNGCIAVFQKVVEVNQGEIAAIMVNGDDATVKHFTKSFTGCVLEPDSHNPEHQMRFISKEDNIDVRVIGKLLWYCMDINGID